MSKNEWLRWIGSITFFIGIEYLISVEYFLNNLIIFLSFIILVLSIIPSRNKYAKRIAYLQLSFIGICAFAILKFYSHMYYYNVWRYLKFWRLDNYKVGLIIMFVGIIVICKGIKNFLDIDTENDFYI